MEGSVRIPAVPVQIDRASVARMVRTAECHILIFLYRHLRVIGLDRVAQRDTCRYKNKRNKNGIPRLSDGWMNGERDSGRGSEGTKQLSAETARQVEGGQLRRQCHLNLIDSESGCR